MFRVLFGMYIRGSVGLYQGSFQGSIRILQGFRVRGSISGSALSVFLKGSRRVLPAFRVFGSIGVPLRGLQ